MRSVGGDIHRATVADCVRVGGRLQALKRTPRMHRDASYWPSLDAAPHRTKRGRATRTSL